MKKIIVPALMLFLAHPLMAQTAASSPKVSFSEVLITLIIILALVMLIVVFTLQQVVTVLKKETLGEKYHYEEDRSFWEKMLSLKPLAAEKDIDLGHDYDGIRELNNPIPPWFNVLFYGTIVFAFGYLLLYHIFETTPLQAQEYKNELILAEQQKEEYVKKMGNLIDESNVTAIDDKTKLAAAATVYTQKCAVCHGEKGEGKVGPNLTDEYWIHGGDIKSVFKTIKYGVPAKGMVAWGNSLKAQEMQELASYLLIMQGTNPPGGKEPQGDKYTPEGVVADSTASSTNTTANAQ